MVAATLNASRAKVPRSKSAALAPLARGRPQGKNLGDGERQRAQDVFLEEFARTGIVLIGCQAAGITRQAVDAWRAKDDFANRYAQAELDANDVIRGEIRRRGVDGLIRKKFTGKGEPVIDPETGEQYVEREYSDTLISLVARSRMPEFREKTQADVNLTGGVTIYLPDRKPAAE